MNEGNPGAGAINPAEGQPMQPEPDPPSAAPIWRDATNVPAEPPAWVDHEVSSPQPAADLYRSPLPAPWMIAPRFVSSRPMSIIAVVMLAIAGCVGVATSIHFVVGLGMIVGMGRGTATLTEANNFDNLTRTISLLQVVVTLVSGIAFMRWEWRLVRNAPELGAKYGMVDPRGSVTAWLLPIRNLWKPYQVIRDLHDRLLDPLTSSAGWWLIRLWWLFWLLGAIFGWVLVSFIHPTSMSTMTALWAGLVVSGALTAADAVLAIAVVLQLQRLGDARMVNNQGNPQAAIEMIARSQRRRVTLTPFLIALALGVVVSVPGFAAYPEAAKVGANDGAWQAVTGLDGSFSVEFPGRPVVVPIAANASNGTTGGESAQASIGTIRFGVTEYSYEAGMLALMGPDEAYSNIASALTSSGALILHDRDLTIGDLPAKEIEATLGGTYVIARYCISGDRIFSIEIDSTGRRAELADQARFFGSFVILK